MLNSTHKKRIITIAAHLLFWTVWHVFYYFSIRIQGWEEHFWLHNAWLMPIDLAAVYFTAYYLVPEYLLKKRYTSFTLIFIISVLVFIFLERLVYYYILYPVIFPAGTERPLFYYPSFLNIFLGMYSFAFLFSGVRLFRNWQQDQKRQFLLEKQNTSSELALLRSQINPHFLFNTLNNIDSLVFIDQQKASDSILKLSEIMRYMLYEANTDFVPLEKEMDYLNSMIDLLRLRLKDPDFIHFVVEGDPYGKNIPPMLLVPFIENAYKHGRKTGPSPGIHIHFTIGKKYYELQVYNQYEPHLNSVNKDQTGGIGLANVRRRLELLYQQDYIFTIENKEPEFRVYLKIPLLHTPVTVVTQTVNA